MASAFVKEKISSHKIVVFSKTTCPFSKKAKAALKEVGAENHDYVIIEVDTRDDEAALREALGELTGAKSVCITMKSSSLRNRKGCTK